MLHSPTKCLQPNRLNPKSDKCYFVGYPKDTIGYYFYHHTEGKVCVVKNGVFLEKEFLAKVVSGRTMQLDEIAQSPMMEQRVEAPEVVPDPTPAPEPEEPPCDEDTLVKCVAEPRKKFLA